MTPEYAEYLKTNASPEELRAILGAGWAICRKTPRNMERYQRCITRKEYDAATRQALAQRGAT